MASKIPNPLTAAVPTPHTLFDDAQALLIGTLFVALGLMLMRHVGLMTGGTVGLALLSNYAFSAPFGVALLLINAPFYVMGWFRLGWRFTLKTILAVLLLTTYMDYLPRGIQFESVHPVAAAVVGGLIIGTGFIILFRHKASLGGLNILVMWLQEKFNWRAGWVQLGLDAAIMCAALPWITWTQFGLSILAALAMNISLAINHKPGRYAAF